MEYRKLGRTGLNVSAIGLGTEHLERSRETMEEILGTAVDAGVNYIDVQQLWRLSRMNTLVVSADRIFYYQVKREKKIISSSQRNSTIDFFIRACLKSLKKLYEPRRHQEPIWYCCEFSIWYCLLMIIGV